MLNKLKYIILAIVLSLIVYMVYAITSKSNKITAQKENLRKLPVFYFKTLSGDILNKS
jgi:tetrahydromethanopterin S-methyltransferase subunit E